MPHVLSPTALSFLCSAIWIWRLKNPPCIKLLLLEGLGAVFFLLCPVLSTSALTDMFTAGIRGLHLVQTLSVHKSTLFHEDLLAEFVPSSWRALDVVPASKKYLIRWWYAGFLRAGSRNLLLLRAGSAILSPLPVLALKLAQHGWVSERVSFLPALRCTSAAQQIRAPEGPTH